MDKICDIYSRGRGFETLLTFDIFITYIHALIFFIEKLHNSTSAEYVICCCVPPLTYQMSMHKKKTKAGYYVYKVQMVMLGYVKVKVVMLGFYKLCYLTLSYVRIYKLRLRYDK